MLQIRYGDDLRCWWLKTRFKMLTRWDEIYDVDDLNKFDRYSNSVINNMIGDSNISDIVMLMTLWWWLISDVGGRIIMLATFFVIFRICSMYLIGHQHILSPTSVNNIDVTTWTCQHFQINIITMSPTSFEPNHLLAPEFMLYIDVCWNKYRLRNVYILTYKMKLIWQ